MKNMEIETLPVHPDSSFSSGYVQSIAQSYVPGSENSKKSFLEPNFEPNFQRKSVSLYCGSFAVLKTCKNDHAFAQSLDCHKEWCKIKGCNDRTHKQRMARWMEKAQQIETMGYLEISFSPEDRPRTREAWRQIRRQIIRGLKQRGLDRGFACWHWFGSEKPYIFKPHLNFLFDCNDHGYLQELGSIKKMIREVTGLKEVYVNYRYSSNKGQKIHWIKYNTRRTFLKTEWDEAMARELEGVREWDEEKGVWKRRSQFRNFVTWGKWGEVEKWDFVDPDETLGFHRTIEKGCCPVCAEKLESQGVCPIDDLGEKGFEQVESNIWQKDADPIKVSEFKLFQDFQRFKRLDDYEKRKEKENNCMEYNNVEDNKTPV